MRGQHSLAVGVRLAVGLAVPAELVLRERLRDVELISFGISQRRTDVVVKRESEF